VLASGHPTVVSGPFQLRFPPNSILYSNTTGGNRPAQEYSTLSYSVISGTLFTLSLTMAFSNLWKNCCSFTYFFHTV